MNLLKKLLIVAGSIAIFSCSKDTNEPSPENNMPAKNISSKSYYFSDKSFNQIKYLYDDWGKLIKKEEYNTKGEFIFSEYYLYFNERLVKIERSTDKGKIAEFRYTYTNDLISSIEYWLADAASILEKSHQIHYEYKDGKVSKSVSTFYNGNPSFYTLYTYANGNVISIKGFDLATHALLEENIFYYDNKINPFYNTTNEYLGHPITSSKNNVIAYRIISQKHTPVNPQLSFAYTYNEEGYPVEKYIKGKEEKRYIDEYYTYTH